MLIYLIGSLRSPEVPRVAKLLRYAGHEVFDEWYAPGPKTDEHWRDYEMARGHTFVQALQGYHVEHVFQFDLYHLKRADAGVLLLPAGRSGHLELGWMLGRGKLGYVVLDHSDRWDIMYKFATAVFETPEQLVMELQCKA